MNISLSVSSSLKMCLALLGALSMFNCTLPNVDKSTSSPIFFEMFGENFGIPEDYDTYTLFISTSYFYTEHVSKKEIIELKKWIAKFGESIGERNLAVWVRNPDEDTLNVELGKTYADRLYKWYKLNLNYSDGPFLIFMTHHPNHPPKEKDIVAVISFGEKTAKYQVEAIEHLEARIRRREVSRFGVMAVNYWIDLKSKIAKHVDKIKINLKVIEFTISPQ